MKTSMLPFNIDLLYLKPVDVKDMREVKVLDTFDGMAKNFHPDGLFSVETFGKAGEEKRNRMFAYINMYTSVFHPVLFKAICDLKGLYSEILSGKGYAVFDEKLKDFVKSDATQGQTGYAFFVKHFPRLQFELRPSPKREFNIKLMNKYRNDAMLDKLVVMPAGLRDYTVDENGKPSEDEINVYYRKIMSICSMVQNVNTSINPEYLDSVRFNIQIAVLDIYNYITNLLEGKSKLILGKFASRKIVDSTRNVITSYIPETPELHSPKTAKGAQTVVGLYQYMRCIMPLAVKHLRDTYLSRVFLGSNSPAVLVNKKTLKKEMVELDPDYYDEWMTYEGLEKTMARFGEENLRHELLEVGDKWMGLIYEDGKTFRFMQDIDELPQTLDKAHVRPISFAELLYISLYKDSDQIPAFGTRYPITGYGSIYPCYMFLMTTVRSKSLIELDDDWQPTESLAVNFPISGEQFYNSFSPPVKSIGRLGADYDGDTMSLTAVLSQEAREEVKRTLNSRNMHVGVDGRMNFSSNDDVISLVLASMTS